MRRRAYASFIWIVCGLFPAGSVAQDTVGECAKFIVLDTDSVKTDENVYQKVQSSICNKNELTKTSAEDDAVKAGVPLPIADDVLSVKFDGNRSVGSGSTWFQSFCSSQYSEVSVQLQQKTLQQRFSDNAAKTVQDCFQAVSGMYGSFKVLQGRRQFQFDARYKSVNAETLHAIKASFQPADAVSNCDPSNPFFLSPNEIKTNNGRDLRNHLQVVCNWANKDVSLTIVTFEGPVYAFGLPTIPPTPSPHPYVTACQCKFSFARASIMEQQSQFKTVTASCPKMQPNTPIEVHYEGRVYPDKNIQHQRVQLSLDGSGQSNTQFWPTTGDADETFHRSGVQHLTAFGMVPGDGIGIARFMVRRCLYTDVANQPVGQYNDCTTMETSTLSVASRGVSVPKQKVETLPDCDQP